MYSIVVITWAVITALLWRTAHRRARPLPAVWRWTVRSALALFFATVIGYTLVPLLRPILRGEPALPAVVVTLGYLWYPGVLQITILVCVLGFAWRYLRGRRARRSAVKLAPATSTPVESPPSVEPERPPIGSVPDAHPLPASRSMSRRDALRLAVACTPPLATAGLAAISYAQRGDFSIRSIDLHVPSLPEDLDGLRLIHLSDIHHGSFFPEQAMAKLRSVIDSIEAEAVLFTGDLIDRGNFANLPAALEFMEHLASRRPLVMIEGNHDLMDAADYFERVVRERGLNLLLNDDTTLSLPGRKTPIQCLGTTWGDMRTEKPRWILGETEGRVLRDYEDESAERIVAGLAKRLRSDAFPILMAHHPHTVDFAARHGFPLQLSGHTHGGQLMLTEHIGAGPLRFKYWRGVHQIGPTTLVISNGIGNWFPLRCNAPAELGVLRLSRSPLQ